jgi:hypothetical protein
MKGEQRRRFSRIPFAMNAEITVGAKSYRAAEIKDIGVCGTFPIKTQLAEGTACRVRIYLGGPDAEPVIQVDGNVLRTDPEAVVVKFVSIDPDSLYHLQNIIRYNAPDLEVVEEEINKHPGLV